MKEYGWTSHRDSSREGTLHHFSRVWGSVHSRLAHSNLGFFLCGWQTFSFPFWGNFGLFSGAVSPVSFRVQRVCFFRVPSRFPQKSNSFETGSDLKIYKTTKPRELWGKTCTNSAYTNLLSKKLHQKKSLVKLTGKWNGVVLGHNKKTGCFNYVGVLKFRIIILYYDKWRWVVFDAFLL